MGVRQEEADLFDANVTGIKAMQAFARGVRLSKINEVLAGADTVTVLGRLQQRGILRIIYNITLDKEPVVQLTDKGKQLVSALLFSSS
jgi:hypothetical protein